MTFLLTGAEGLDRIKCMEMALVHDLAESLVGDITPYCGVSKKDKEVLEMEAINKICGLIKPRGDHILQLFYVSFLLCVPLTLCFVMQLRSCQKNTESTFASSHPIASRRVVVVFEWETIFTILKLTLALFSGWLATRRRILVVKILPTIEDKPFLVWDYQPEEQMIIS